MISFVNLFENIKKISLKNFDESWSDLILFIELTIDNKTQIKSLLSSIDNEYNWLNYNLIIDSNSFDLEDLDYCPNDKTLQLIINKSNPKTINSVSYYFFFSEEKFKHVYSNFNVFNFSNPINSDSNKINIVVNELQYDFGGPFLNITSSIKTDFSERIHLPTFEQIKQNVSFVTDDSIVINLEKNAITYSRSDKGLNKMFLLNFAKLLTSSLVSEFYRTDKIILRGVKKIDLSIFNEDSYASQKNVIDLVEVVKWTYEEKTETRISLFLDRVSLDIDYNKPYLDELLKVLNSAFSQSKERYNFSIIERKDQYLKELKDLLKDLKSISDLYSTKIRNLLSTILKDFLAAIFLITFSFIAKIPEFIKMEKPDSAVKFIFNGLGLYFIISLILQILTDLADIILSNKETKYWKIIAREYISKSDFDKHYNNSLGKREISFYVFYFFITLLYLCLIVFSFNFPDIWKKI